MKDEPQFRNCYMNGSIIMKHPSLHEFRTKSDKMNIYNSKYEQSKDRALRLQVEHHEGYLEKYEWNEGEPIRKYYLRPR